MDRWVQKESREGDGVAVCIHAEIGSEVGSGLQELLGQEFTAKRGGNTHLHYVCLQELDPVCNSIGGGIGH